MAVIIDGKEVAKENHIECVTGSIEVLGKNINKGFFGVIIAAVVALIAFVLSKPISKSVKNKKSRNNNIFNRC